MFLFLLKVTTRVREYFFSNYTHSCKLHFFKKQGSAYTTTGMERKDMGGLFMSSKNTRRGDRTSHLFILFFTFLFYGMVGILTIYCCVLSYAFTVSLPSADSHAEPYTDNYGGLAFALFLLEEGEFSLLIRQPKKVDDSSSPTTGKIECCNIKIP
jgi:hypothetical protein